MKIVIVGQLSHERRPRTGSRPQVGHPPDGTDRLLLDQPEDDLDNKLIKQPAVETLKNIRTRRQTLVSTDNANIVVTSAAENILVLEHAESLPRIATEGTLQVPAVKATSA